MTRILGPRRWSCSVFSFRLKYPYSCFSSHFCLLVCLGFFSVLMLPMLLQAAAVISLSLLFLTLFLNPRIDASMQYSILASLLLLSSFLDTYSLSKSSLKCKTLYIIINFLVLWFICLSSSFVHFKDNPGYLTRRTAYEFILLNFFRMQGFVHRHQLSCKSGPFVYVLLCSILRMVLSNLRVGLPKCLFF